MSGLPGAVLDWIRCISNVFLAVSLVALCNPSTLKTEVLDIAAYQHCSYAAAAFTMGCYIWLCLKFLPRGHGSRLPLYKQKHVLQSFRAVHGLIADIFIFSFSFKLHKASRPGIAILAFMTVNTFMNMITLVYHAVLHQIYALYLLTVWLATFQDGWSSKTHNKWWWIFFRCLPGASTPETSYQDELVSQQS